MRQGYQDRQLLYAVRGAAQRRDEVVAAAQRRIAEAEADLKAAVEAADAHGCARSWIAEALGVARSSLYDLYQLPRRGVEATEDVETAGSPWRPGAREGRQSRSRAGLGL